MKKNEEKMLRRLALKRFRGNRGRRGIHRFSQRPLVQDGSVTTRCNGRTIHCLTIIGQIEGHYILPSQNKTTKYEHVIPQIVAVEEDPQIDGLLMLLNTVGRRCGSRIGFG